MKSFLQTGAKGIAFSAAILLVSMSLHTRAMAQESYVNFEAGQVQPLARATLSHGGNVRDLLLVCNTAGDCLEIYDATAPYAFVDRVRTGLSPVTVRWNASRGSAYTCNQIGDSVTCISIVATGSNNGVVSVRASQSYTAPVGDEPCDILFLDDRNEALVSLRSRSAVTIRNATNMAAISARELLDTTIPTFGSKVALKHPGLMAMPDDHTLYVLDRTDNDDVGMDIDMLVAKAPMGAATGNPITNSNYQRAVIGGMGTTRHALAMNSAGTRMFVVGMDAQQDMANSESQTAALETGFVQSWMWVVDLQNGPQVIPESQPAGVVTPSLNLNRDYAFTNLSTVPKNKTLAQPTGVALLESDAGLERVVVTAFSSDRVGILTPDSSQKGGWFVQRVDVPVLNTGLPASDHYSMAGTRGVLVAADLQLPGGSQPGAVFVLNSVDNSLAVIDPWAATLQAQIRLSMDPTPNVIRKGRAFLYSAAFSDSGTVSCSSCHIDGHTDGIQWNLSVNVEGPDIPLSFVDKPRTNTQGFPANKGVMVTQTLRGLVNHRVDGGTQAQSSQAQSLFTNAPYHWRGDRFEFKDFNQTFVGLFGLPAIAGTNPPEGLTQAAMSDFTAFVETIRHPPNPEQLITRKVRGKMGDPDDLASGSGEARGLKLYHTANSVSGISCSMCHVTPEGSNNRMTEHFEFANGEIHPVETAAVRHLFDREAVIEVDSLIHDDNNQIWTRLSGLTHSGNVGPAIPNTRSINKFVERFSANLLNPVGVQSPMGDPAAKSAAEAITAFVRAFDSGVAPMIGYAYTLVPGSGNNSRVADFVIDQVMEANVGLVVQVRDLGVRQGWWYDAEAATFRLADPAMPGVTAAFSHFDTVATQPNSLVTLQAVPVGSARRIANLDGVAGASPGSGGPTNIALAAMTPPTHWEQAVALRRNWEPSTYLPVLTSINNLRSVRAEKDLQGQLIAALNNNGFVSGISEFKHEPPRRFRVSGDNIRHGAVLVLSLPQTVGAPVDVELPLFPTKYRSTADRQVWETTVEADAMMTFALLCGGPFLDPVKAVMDLQLPGTGINPAVDNMFTFVVRNEDGTQAQSTGSLTVQHVRQ